VLTVEAWMDIKPLRRGGHSPRSGTEDRSFAGHPIPPPRAEGLIAAGPAVGPCDGGVGKRAPNRPRSRGKSASSQAEQVQERRVAARQRSRRAGEC
jgi:hypothetical protein